MNGMSTQKTERVVGFQHWLNGHEAGYGSIKKMYGKPYMSEAECRDLGHSEGAGMTYRYETDEKIEKFCQCAEQRGLIGNPYPCRTLFQALRAIRDLPNIEIENGTKGDTLMRLYWHDEVCGCGGCISIPA